MNASSEHEGPRPDNSSPVGYGNPPQESRFKKGASGNPKGRPRGTHNLAGLFAKTLREKVVINEHGRRKTVTKLEAAIKQLVNKSASGDLRSLQLLVNFAREAETHETLPTHRAVVGEIDQKVIESIVRRFQPETQVKGQNDEQADCK